MSNKYQEALDILKYFLHEVCKCTCQNLGAFENDLQELVDKETPMKVIEKLEVPVSYEQYRKCPKCENLVSRMWLYCPDCGQKLDWSEE